MDKFSNFGTRGKMKYNAKTKVFKGNNVFFDAANYTAISYDWWIFVKRINDKVVFNSFKYSNSTTKHQFKVRAFMRAQGIPIDYEIEAPDGLQNLESAFKHHMKVFFNKVADANKPRIRPGTRERLIQEAELHRSKAGLAKELSKYASL